MTSAYKSFKGDSLQAEISKIVKRLVRRCDQDERETEGAVRWNSMGPKLRNRTRIGFNTFMKEATRGGSSIA